MDYRNSRGDLGILLGYNTLCLGIEEGEEEEEEMVNR